MKRDDWILLRSGLERTTSKLFPPKRLSSAFIAYLIYNMVRNRWSPSGRYLQLRNVWFLAFKKMMERDLTRSNIFVSFCERRVGYRIIHQSEFNRYGYLLFCSVESCELWFTSHISDFRVFEWCSTCWNVNTTLATFVASMCSVESSELWFTSHISDFRVFEWCSTCWNVNPQHPILFFWLFI